MKALIVDDEPFAREELREMLADLENSSTSALAQMRALLVELPPRHAPTAPDKEACHD